MIDWTQVVTAEAQAEAALMAEANTLTCSRLQGRLTLGPEVCAMLDAMADDPATPWAMREAIVNAIEWRCTSQTMDEMSYLLGFSFEQRVQLFRMALGVDV